MKKKNEKKIAAGYYFWVKLVSDLNIHLTSSDHRDHNTQLDYHPPPPSPFTLHHIHHTPLHHMTTSSITIPGLASTTAI